MSTLPETPFIYPDIVEAMKDHLRPDDVIVFTTPKTGQTLTQFLLHCIKTKGELTGMGVGTGDILSVSPWLEYPWIIPETIETGEFRRISVEDRVAELDAVPAPRVFKSHMPLSMLPVPNDAAVASQLKRITITRHIMDVPYSLYQHISITDPDFKKRKGMPEGIPPFDVFFNEAWLNVNPEDPLRTFNYINFIKDSWPSRNDPNTLWVEYEDLVKNKEAVGRKIVDFLGWPQPSDDEWKKYVEMTSVERMQEYERTHIFCYGERHFIKKGFVREGKVGKNRDQLTDDMKAAVRAKCEAELPPDAVKYVYRE